MGPDLVYISTFHSSLSGVVLARLIISRLMPKAGEPIHFNSHASTAPALIGLVHFLHESVAWDRLLEGKQIIGICESGCRPASDFRWYPVGTINGQLIEPIRKPP